MPTEHDRDQRATHMASSEANSRKLDRILVWIEGDTTNPGFSDRLRLVEAIMFGKEGRRGLIQEHIIMWRIHVWALCGLSTILGSALTLLIQKVIKII